MTFNCYDCKRLKCFEFEVDCFVWSAAVCGTYSRKHFGQSQSSGVKT